MSKGESNQKKVHTWALTNAVTYHLVHRKDRTIRTARCEIEEKYGESLCGCARQQLFPPFEP